MHILISDANTTSRSKLKARLKKGGHQVTETSSGDEAFKSAKASQPDMIISDILLPELDGFRLCQKFKSNTQLRGIPFIFYTAAYTDSKNELLALSLGASRFIIKPVSEDQLLTLLDEVMAEHDTTLTSPHSPEAVTPPEQSNEKDPALHAAAPDKTDKTLHNSLSASEQLGENLFRSFRDVIIVSDKDRIIVNVNEPALLDVFGYSANDILGKSARIIYADDHSYASAGDTVFDINENHKGEIIEVRLRRKNSEIFIGEMYALKLLNEQGNAIGNIGIIRDITERQQIEQQLIKSEAQFRMLSEAAPIGIFLADQDGNTIYANRLWQKISGLSLQEITQNGWCNSFHPNDRPHALAAWSAYLSSKEEFSHTGRVVTPGGEIKWIHARAITLQGETPGSRTHVGTIEDTSRQKASEMELRDSEGKFRAIFDNAMDGILAVDINTKKFHTCNTEMLHMLGYSMHELLNLKIHDIHPADDLPFVLEQFEKQARNEIFAARDIPFKRKDGSIFYADIHNSLIELNRKKYLLGIIRDITERKKAEDILRHVAEHISTKTGEQLFHSMTTFIAETLDTRYALIGNIVPERPDTVRTIAVYARGSIIDNFEYKLADTPCEKVLKESLCFFPENVQQLFPGDYLLFDMEVESYIGTRLYNNSGQITGILAVMDDKPMKDEQMARSLFKLLSHRAESEIDRLQTIKLLEESENKYRLLFEESNDAVYLLDDNTMIIIDCNRKASKMSTYSEDELKGMPFMQLHPLSDSEQLSVLLRESLKKNRDTPIIGLHQRRKTGAVFPVEINMRIMEINQRHVIMCIVSDISDRELAQAAEERFSTIFRSSPVGMCTTSPDGTLIELNPALHNMLGYDEGELQTNFAAITHPEDRDENIVALKDMLDGKQDSYKLEKRYIRKDGSILWAKLSVTAVRNAANKLKYSFALIEDISEHKKLEDQLRHIQKMEAVGQLAGGIAHDFNNLLTAIIGYGNLIRMKLNQDDPLLYHVNQILAMTERGASLTQGLLIFSRDQTLSLKPLDLNELLSRTAKLLPRLIGEDIDIITNISMLPLTVLGDSGQIEQILINMASNSRDAMPEGGTITLETKRHKIEATYEHSDTVCKSGEYALITIKDTGKGIKKENISKIFEPFFTTKPSGTGTGLGLAMSYGIIKQHKGYIDVNSSPGKGALFTIYIPLMQEKSEIATELSSMNNLQGSETILLAEDDKNVRVAQKAILQEFGFTVIEAVNGQDAIDKFKEHSDIINLLLLDVVMPKKSGKDAYDEIKKHSPAIKAIFTSGYTEAMIHAKGILEDDHNFISKPVSPYTLVRKIREVLS
ncbi:MAG: PAS domain S-box protein [Nitrospira sp.]|nr:PAS domain S-box protein [Nitrospira sp.]